MGSRRKGERPIEKVVVGWSEDHQVARSMRRADGDSWFRSWLGQMSTPYHRLTKATKLSEERLREIEAGAPFTHAELAALAKAWWITPEGLLASMPDPERVIG